MRSSRRKGFLRDEYASVHSSNVRVEYHEGLLSRVLSNLVLSRDEGGALRTSSGHQCSRILSLGSIR
jgi:hypothetical protein